MRFGKGRRAAMWGLAVLSLPVLALVLAPEGRLACAEPYVSEASPDGAWTLTLCRRPMWLAMPGGASDAPGWLVLRDRTGAIRGVTELGMVQSYGAAAGLGTAWLPDRVERPLVTEMPLPRTHDPARVWLEDRVWRLRALVGLVTSDDAFH
jgi:hypothetical protein